MASIRARLLLAAVVVALVSTAPLVMSSPGFAQADPVAERKKTMELNSDQLRILVPIARGEAAFDGTKVNEAASAILEQLTRAQGLFPEGSGGGKTRALPAIWEQPDPFAAAFTQAKEAASAVAASGEGNDEQQFQETFRVLGGSCADCHRTFRAPES